MWLVRKLLAVVVGFMLALVIQTALINRWFPGVHPDMMLSMVTIVGLIGGPWTGAFAGIAGGLLVDLLGGRLLGLGALSFCATGALAGWLGQGLFRENRVVPFLAGAVATIVYHVLFILGALAFGVTIPLGETLVRLLFPSICYNGLLTGLLFPVVYKVKKRLD
jgi:rod shape-determining protein MreD